MKKIFKNFIILFVFCLTFTFGGILNLNYSYADSSSSEPVEIGTANEVEIGTANELVKYINSYGKSGHGSPTDYIVLTANIDMSQYYDESTQTTSQIVLTNSIGTASNPFTGTFDGNGYTIKNLKIDARTDLTEATSSVTDNQYAGLFGYVKGATLKNVAFSGSSEIVVGGYKTVDSQQVDVVGTNNVYAGILVGRAENATISMIQNLASLNFKSSFNCNTNFGSIIGSATNSSISYITSNNFSLGNWTFSRSDAKVYNIGGLAGVLSNVKTNFVTLTETFKANIESTFVGDFNLGGIAGVVSQGNSEIYNIAIENTYSITDSSVFSADTTINIGEIAGKLSTPTPISGNLAYIHFKNNSLSRFGETNGYEFLKKEQENDYITSSLYGLNALEASNPNYFANQEWHPLLGDWDFANTWYVGGQSIKLQNFYADFAVSFANNSSVFKMANEDFATSYRYGSKVEMDFVFEIENEKNLSEFYDITSINLYSKEIAKIITTKSSDGKVSYRVSDSDLVEISATDNGFKLVINKVTLATQGEYSISTTAKTFKASIYSKLFEEDGSEKEDVPGYVYFAEGANTTTETLTLGQMTYGQTYRLRTREKPGSPNLFVGWYLVDEDGVFADDPISTSKILEIKVGTGSFIGNLSVCAKYLNNAQIVNFILDDGISKIELNSSEIIDQSGQSTSVSKSNSSFKMDVYVNDNYEFNVEDFVKTLNTYKSVDSNEQFCTLVAEESEENKFSFILNMTVLNKEDFGETFEIKAQTTALENGSNSWIWIVVGVAGGVLLIGLIVLIVVLVKRNRYGGMGGGSFKSYKKGMYY